MLINKRILILVISILTLIGLTVFLALNTNKLPVVSNMFNTVNTILKTNEENKILKSRFERFEQQIATKQLLEQENKVLKDIIKATVTLKKQGYNPIQGTVISRDMTNKDNFLTISKGQKEGIKKNMIVLSTDGVIGRVVEVDTNSSEVQLLSGEDARVNSVAATLKENKKVLGIIRGYDQEEKGFLLSDINEKVEIGSTVITSGLGGVYPAGLEVGKITSAKYNQNVTSNTYSVKPSADFVNITEVIIILNEQKNES